MRDECLAADAQADSCRGFGEGKPEVRRQTLAFRYQSGAGYPRRVDDDRTSAYAVLLCDRGDRMRGASRRGNARNAVFRRRRTRKEKVNMGQSARSGWCIAQLTESRGENLGQRRRAGAFASKRR
jgi:hypothetical protein